MSDEEKKIWPGSYEVGYGKPPAKGRFVKGKSGNPSGRPRKKKNAEATTSDATVRDTFLQEADRKIEILEKGKPVETTLHEAAPRALGIAALKGGVKALKLFMEKDERYRSERRTEIENNHQFWRNFKERYDEIKLKAPEKLKDLPHPEDLIFPADRLVEVAFGSPEEAEKKWRLIALARDLFFIWGQLDDRRLTENKPELIAPMSIFTYLALKINPARSPTSISALRK